ncbi:Peptide-N(4)-(N-acetyl-beta-glucosaminyl)asparagine amidase [Senna tora]|uniref:Peptide-N(4)-(N-acetyl-beta-glucosaminyl)asparagine amidase n=1 Tax=Senna tora TaxID=362788 RepID=A0A834SMN6_9FABA|nr:Peptide-N(4)-(N-acetyl-beta-glucosaminyl)asparagine amidase [Senna tora]
MGQEEELSVEFLPEPISNLDLRHSSSPLLLPALPIKFNSGSSIKSLRRKCNSHALAYSIVATIIARKAAAVEKHDLFRILMAWSSPPEKCSLDLPIIVYNRSIKQAMVVN